MFGLFEYLLALEHIPLIGTSWNSSQFSFYLFRLGVSQNACIRIFPYPHFTKHTQDQSWLFLLHRHIIYCIFLNIFNNISIQFWCSVDFNFSCWLKIFNICRYYLNRFKDVYRQATIDMMLGQAINEDMFQERTEEEDNAGTADHVKLLIEDCKKLLIPNPETILGSWGLIDADPV